LSKETLLYAVFFQAQTKELFVIIAFLGFLSVSFTSFYLSRMLFNVFLGKEEEENKRQTEPAIFIIPLGILALLTLWFWHNPNPFVGSWVLYDFMGLSIRQEHSYSVPIISIFAIVLGFVAYRKLKEKSMRVNHPIYQGFYLDQVYLSIGISVLKISYYLHRVDRKWIDGVLHFTGVGTVVFAKFLALFDRFIIDGPVNLIASLTSLFGRIFASLNARNAQIQLALLVLGIILILSLLLFF
jgi:NADH-quinone oxidoreductase subunit L